MEQGERKGTKQGGAHNYGSGEGREGRKVHTDPPGLLRGRAADSSSCKISLTSSAMVTTRGASGTSVGALARKRTECERESQALCGTERKERRKRRRRRSREMEQRKDGAAKSTDYQTAQLFGWSKNSAKRLRANGGLPPLTMPQTLSMMEDSPLFASSRSLDPFSCKPPRARRKK
jgi:hypothetical protein